MANAERLPGLASLYNDPSFSDAVLKIMLDPASQQGKRKTQSVLKEVHVSSAVLGGASTRFSSEIKRWMSQAPSPQPRAKRAKTRDAAGSEAGSDSGSSSKRTFEVTVTTKTDVEAVEACLQYTYGGEHKQRVC
jgi:hypothetical protein